MIWSLRHSANVSSLSFKKEEEKRFKIPIFDSNCKACHFNTSSPGGLLPLAGEINKMLQKWVKYAQNRPFLCNFNVCSYLIHRTFQNENLLYYTYYQTYHFTMFVMGKMYNHRYVSKVYLYSHDIYKGSMHNKRFIILCPASSLYMWVFDYLFVHNMTLAALVSERLACVWGRERAPQHPSLYLLMVIKIWSVKNCCFSGGKGENLNFNAVLATFKKEAELWEKL